ncbi:MAG: hypothetical protein AAGF11_36165 [Myxococcota bacterium]
MPSTDDPITVVADLNIGTLGERFAGHRELRAGLDAVLEHRLGTLRSRLERLATNGLLGDAIVPFDQPLTEQLDDDRRPHALQPIASNDLP